MTTSALLAPHSPTLPTRGRAFAGAWGKRVPNSPRRTSPFVGEDGRGVATR
jgi:hypothetical protein